MLTYENIKNTLLPRYVSAIVIVANQMMRKYGDKHPAVGEYIEFFKYMLDKRHVSAKYLVNLGRNIAFASPFFDGYPVFVGAIKRPRSAISLDEIMRCVCICKSPLARAMCAVAFVFHIGISIEDVGFLLNEDIDIKNKTIKGVIIPDWVVGFLVDYCVQKKDFDDKELFFESKSKNSRRKLRFASVFTDLEAIARVYDIHIIDMINSQKLWKRINNDQLYVFFRKTI